MLLVGTPGGEAQAQKINTETYFRQQNNYGAFISNNTNRKKVVYGAANNGILHAVDAEQVKNCGALFHH